MLTLSCSRIKSFNNNNNKAISGAAVYPPVSRLLWEFPVDIVNVWVEVKCKQRSSVNAGYEDFMYTKNDVDYQKI